ncbi:probable peroxisomal acyl-coenzyme A oxidase 1 [Drosophila subpulchrella]|uniref:probable peroxisomal acyl-coenzyme A oxidase 1 n=1 Tax=Drosophila subpulchrella TaxID=1486046 RepID=UPI0018A16217|nr:probable peroxisomal acyl-coenzyme A oxidase 1 [Drosophila subpulchrella]
MASSTSVIPNSVIPATVNPDLQKERDAASFSSEEFATWWSGGEEILKFNRGVRDYLQKDVDVLEMLQLQNKSHEEIIEFSTRGAIEAAKKLRRLQEERNPGGDDYWPKLYDHPALVGLFPGGNPFSVMYVMLVKALQAQCTPEQYEDFGKRLERFEICGTYAQTELGHGTYLRGLETRADFDPKTDEFVLNTPKISSYKFWPGGLGHSSNYCLVMAQLYIDNKSKGPHMFFIQVRDEETHEPLPGVHIGDIGKKMGFIGVNNGFMGLKNVRIPRNRMLMRHAQVNADGTYVNSPTVVLIYFAMVRTRCVIARNNAYMLAAASTIATRYSAVRRQSPINPKEREPQIIDHVTQQMKLFPEIATSLAYRLASDYLWNLYDVTFKDIENGMYERLPELHSLSCALKVTVSTDSSAGVERLRLACGGHGYLTSSNMSNIYVNATAACTYEGENTVLLLQIGRYLMKTWRAALSGAPLPPTVRYLGEVQKNPEFGTWTGSWENMVKAMQYTAANKTRVAFKSLSNRLARGETEGNAANHTGIELTQAAELHGRAFVFGCFTEGVTGPKSKTRSAAFNQVLENLLELYLVKETLNQMSYILRFIELTDTDLSRLQDRLETVLTKLRPDAVAIVDGFDFSDLQLNSTLGSYDGNAYERIFDAALKNPVNQKSVPKSFHEVLKPFMKSNI